MYNTTQRSQGKKENWLNTALRKDQKKYIKFVLPIPPAFGKPVIEKGEIVGMVYRCPWCRGNHRTKTNGNDGYTELAGCGKGFIRFFFDDVRHSVSNHSCIMCTRDIV